MKAPFPAPVETWHNDTYAAINPARPELSMKGKKIIVTGGGGGIGRGTAEAFAAAGAESVAISGRRESMLLQTKEYIESRYDTRITTHVADVTDTVAMKKAASEIGRWDVLVMNAGYLSTPGLFMENDVDEWWKAFEINVKGAFVTMQALVPTKSDHAVVVATSSAAVNLPSARMTTASSYVSSKLGLMKFIELLAADHTDIFFTTIHPGVVATEMSAKSDISDLAQDTVELPSHYTVWVASPEAAFLRNKFSWCNWDVNELKAKAKEIEESDMFTTTIKGWPFSP